jgi:beta-lactamase regulating signal transducer with metallopeptidase domain/protocatechuate 3,4-dioxygenase beta subunit
MELYLHELASLAWLQFLQVTVLVAMVGLLVRFGCRSRPHLAYVLWILVLLKCLTPPIWSSPAGIFSWAQFHTLQSEGGLHTAVADASMTVPGPRQIASEIPENLNRFSVNDPTTTSKTPISTIRNPSTSERTGIPWMIVFTSVWFGGTLGLLGIVSWKWLGYCRALRYSAVPVGAAIESMSAQIAQRLGLRRKIPIIVTQKRLGPAVFGLMRPVVVLPQAVVSGKTPQQIEPILAHELVHIRRGDNLWGFLQMAVEILWWFHPLIWWANRQTCLQRERCCDEEVVATLRCKPAIYAHCLLDVLEAERNWGTVPIFVSTKMGLSPLGYPGFWSAKITAKRLEDIMIRASSFHEKTPRWCWAVLIVAALLVLPGRAIVLGGDQNSSDQPQNTAEKTMAKTNQLSKAETIITGQVVDPAGKPLPGVQVAVVGRSRGPKGGGDPETLGITKSDAKGRFNMAIPRISSAGFYSVHALAVAENYGLGWQSIGLDVEQPEVKIQLPKEQTIRGQVVDSKGQPAADAKVHVTWIGYLVRGNVTGIQFWKPPKQMPFWPGPVTTDQNGRFTLRGVNCDQGVKVQILDDRFARDWIEIKPSAESPDAVTLSPPPAQIIAGEVICQDTNRPMPNARIDIGADAAGQGNCILNMSGQADQSGHFRLVPFSGKVFSVTAHPPEGKPYLTVEKKYKLTLPLDSKEKPISFIYDDAIAVPMGINAPYAQIVLPRGVLLHGKVIEADSGKAVAGAGIQYEGRSRNPYMKEGIKSGWQVGVISDASGAFKIVVPPGNTMLFISGPNNDYIQQEMGGMEIYQGKPGGQRNYAAAFMPLDLKPESEPLELSVHIRRGVTVRGQIVGPEDQSVGEVQMLSRIFMFANEHTFRGSEVRTKQGQFEIHGLDPEKSVPVYFLDAKNKLGAAVDISGKSAEKGPLVVRLNPCGTAMARFVDPDGKPLVKYEPNFQIVVTPGPFKDDKRGEKELAADEDFVCNFDRLNYWDPRCVTDAQGRCTFPSLIPGATYRILLYRDSGDWGEKDFTVKPGETLDLGDIVVKDNE